MNQEQFVIIGVLSSGLFHYNVSWRCDMFFVFDLRWIAIILFAQHVRCMIVIEKFMRFN